ncbi:MAG: flagellar motor switch protein FliG [Deltaproteobacteria bacterium]|nr:flagellar motor switch protein FliG [Nannocystaceae bacterium]
MPERALTGTERSVVLLLSLGEDHAASVLHYLDESNVRQLSECIEKMDSISRSQADAVFTAFEVEHRDSAIGIAAGARRMRRIASRVLGQEKAEDLLAKEIEAPQPLRLLNRIDPETLASLLAKEHGQSLAALLAHVDVDKAAAVLGHLPQDVQVDVVRRMANLESIPHSTIQEAEKALRDELALVSEAKVANVDGLKKAADLVSRLKGAIGEKLIGAIDDSDEELAVAIKRAMFTFEDLLKVEARDMQAVLKEVSTEQLRNALKTATPELRTHILGAMSRRAAEMLMDDLDSMGPVKLSLVEESQSAVVEIALGLQRDGKITIAGAGGEELV